MIQEEAALLADLSIVLAGSEGLSWVRRLGNPAGGLPFSVQMGANGRIARRKLGATTFDELAGWVRGTA